jgi:hypothetical protein
MHHPFSVPLALFLLLHWQLPTNPHLHYSAHLHYLTMIPRHFPRINPAAAGQAQPRGSPTNSVWEQEQEQSIPMTDPKHLPRSFPSYLLLEVALVELELGLGRYRMNPKEKRQAQQQTREAEIGIVRTRCYSLVGRVWRTMKEYHFSRLSSAVAAVRNYYWL